MILGEPVVSDLLMSFILVDWGRSFFCCHKLVHWVLTGDFLLLQIFIGAVSHSRDDIQVSQQVVPVESSSVLLSSIKP